MNTFSKQLGLSAMLAFAANLASATVVSHAGYSWDDTTDVVTGGGLEWLRWTETVGESIDSALTKYTNDGWGLASNVQMAALFNAFGFGARFTWDADENTNQRTYNNNNDNVNDLAKETPDDPEKWFVSIFGNTNPNYLGNEGSTDPREQAAALFGNDPDGDGRYNFAWVNDAYVYQTSASVVSGEVLLAADAYKADSPVTVYADTVFGVALVRMPTGVSRSVPSPGTLLLLALGAFGLGVHRFQGRNQPYL